jgi:hypothetical protein
VVNILASVPDALAVLPEVSLGLLQGLEKNAGIAAEIRPRTLPFSSLSVVYLSYNSTLISHCY